MVFVLDNYDSFTYNLVQYLGELGAEVVVKRNDEVTVEAIRAMAPERIVLSPGPGRPEDAGVMMDVIRELGPTTPMFGVCLGHQAIAQAFAALHPARTEGLGLIDTKTGLVFALMLMNLPIIIWIMAVLFAVNHIVLSKTIFGQIGNRFRSGWRLFRSGGRVIDLVNPHIFLQNFHVLIMRNK